MELLSRARNDFHFWQSLLIALVLMALPFSGYSHAASWQPFGAGWEVLYSGSSSTYRFNGLERLSYNSSNGQWSQKGQSDGGTWANIGSAGQSSTFIGDGAAHSIGAGWSYMYNGSNSRKQDSAWFSYDGYNKFAYNYTEGQWWQKGIDWSKLGSSGISSTFVGDGTERDLNNGWSYKYLSNFAFWSKVGSIPRYIYSYDSGQWSHIGIGQWFSLGTRNVSTAFVGDGTEHSIGSGWSYTYNGFNARKQDSAWFSFNGSSRLAYNYSEGQWWQKGVDWSKVGIAGLSADFIGDGTDHSIGSGWSYVYNGANARNQDSAWFSFSGSTRLAYNYTEGQWWQKGIDWSKLGNAGLSTTFIGDGVDHSIGSGWSYVYNGANARNQDSAWFSYNASNSYSSSISLNSIYRLAYNYTVGQWWQKALEWSKLGSELISSLFIGDGKEHSVGSGMSYMYNGSNARNQDSAWFSFNGANRFAYNYTEGQWWQKGVDWSKFGSAGLPFVNIGDGNYLDLRNGWFFKYDRATDAGVWKDSDVRFAYYYTDGHWQDNIGIESKRLGHSGMSSAFIGDGSWKQFDSGDYFKYDGSYMTWRTGSTEYWRYNVNSNYWQFKWYGSWSTDFASLDGLDIRYLGDHIYVERRRFHDEGTDAPANYYDLDYLVWSMSATSYSRTEVTHWRIDYDGGDQKWSGGSLDVAWQNSDWNDGAAEYTDPDVVVFVADMGYDGWTEKETSGIGFDNMVKWMGYVRNYYDKPIDSVTVCSHGNLHGGFFGSYLDDRQDRGSFYYKTKQNEGIFKDWGKLMATHGDILLYLCSIGQAKAMLDEISLWTNSDVYAHDHKISNTWDGEGTIWWHEETKNWNNNYRNFRKTGAGIWEYKSPGAPIRKQGPFSFYQGDTPD